MATTADIRNGAVILHKSKRMKVIEFQHVKPGKGGAFVRTKLKDIQSGKIIDETFNSGHKLEFIRVEAKGMQFLIQIMIHLFSWITTHTTNYQLPMTLWGMFKTF